MELKIKDHLQHFNNKLYMDVAGGDRIQFKDYFNAGNLMTVMHDWLVENGWASASDAKFPEVFYHHKFMQGKIEEVRWWWRPERGPYEDHGANFFHYEMEVDIRIVVMKKSEVMKHGMKFSTNHGDIEIKTWAKLIMDKDGKWRSHPILKNFLHLYLDRIAQKSVLRHYAFIRRDVNRFKDALKSYFKLPVYSPEPEHQGDFRFTKDFD